MQGKRCLLLGRTIPSDEMTIRWPFMMDTPENKDACRDRGKGAWQGSYHNARFVSASNKCRPLKHM